MNSILMVIAPENFRDEEYLEPRNIFEDNDFNVTVASKGVKTAQGKLGASVEIDKDISAVDINNYRAIVFIGGKGSSIYFEDTYILEMVKEAYESGKIVAAICIAPTILANAGILYDKTSTSHESASNSLKEQGADYTGKPVEIDGNIITANGPEASSDFANAIVNALKGEK